jgi:hypothetical protein
MVKLMAGEETFRTFDLARLTDHISRFSLAALGCAPPVAEPATPVRAVV